MSEFNAAAAAVESWKQVLGIDSVISEPGALDTYTQAVCGSTRQVVAVLKPVSREQVEQIVSIANKTGIPLYPISCGKQWGMGSRLPVKDGAAIVELSAMNRILEINEQFHYTVVEPGVTQQQLLDHIKTNGLALMLNVTGSTSDTSLIGNAMDRGVGYFDSRAHGISNMQIVLGNGQCIQTGFGHFPNAATANLYRHGVGPSLDGLFPQGNFGIVTSACIDLMPKPDAHMAAIIKIDAAEKLPELIDALTSLRSRGIISTIAHVGNRERSYMTLAPLLYEQLIQSGEPEGDTTQKKAVAMLEKGGFGPWSAAIGLLGSRAQLKLAKKEIKRAVSDFAATMFLNDEKVEKAKSLLSALSFIPALKRQLMMIGAVEPVYGFTRGETTDKSLRSIYWAAGDLSRLNESDPDHSDSGVLFCLPIFPADGHAVSRAVSITAETFARHGFAPAITVNLMDAKAMEGVVSLSFNRRDPEQTRKAHACIQEMEKKYVEMGYPPYRVGINSMHQVIDPNDPYWEVVRSVKHALDPNNIIAPGRYSLD